MWLVRSIRSEDGTDVVDISPALTPRWFVLTDFKGTTHRVESFKYSIAIRRLDSYIRATLRRNDVITSQTMQELM